jgi:hypothetical protein
LLGIHGEFPGQFLQVGAVQPQEIESGGDVHGFSFAIPSMKRERKASEYTKENGCTLGKSGRRDCQWLRLLFAGREENTRRRGFLLSYPGTVLSPDSFLPPSGGGEAKVRGLLGAYQKIGKGGEKPEAFKNEADKNSMNST